MLLTLQSCVEVKLPLEKQGGDDFCKAAACPESGPRSTVLKLMQQGVISVLVVLQTLMSTEDYINIGNFMLGQHQLLFKCLFP